ncbi:MAG: tetratricopeptide repeat protein [Deltaproteobacteria bacterium]|nr:MAG: tetratricopeptide repeat protein [Deltaproteobacteria bacterium]
MRIFAVILASLLALSCASAPRRPPTGVTPIPPKEERAVPTPTEERKPESPGVKEERGKEGADLLQTKFSFFVAAVRKGEKSAVTWEDFEGTPYEERAHFLECIMKEKSSSRSASLCYEEHGKRYVDGGALARALVLSLEEGERERQEKLAALIREKGNESLSPREYFALALFRISRGDGPGALKLLEKAEGMDRDSLLLARAQAYLLSGELEEAEKSLEKLTQAGRKRDEARVMQSLVRGEPPDLEGLTPALRQAAVVWTARKLTEEGRAKEAEELILRELEKADSPYLRVALGSAYFSEGRYRDAAEQFRKASEKDPSLPEAHLNLGIVAEVFLDDRDLAIQEYRTYIELGGARKEEVSRWLRGLEILKEMRK